MNWVSYFEENRNNRMEIPWEAGIEVPEYIRLPLIRSLQRFQVGESGEGHHMKRCAARTGDAGYAQAVHLFIAEEQAHARLMARLLDGLGGGPIKAHWSDIGFIAMRRLLGINFEVMVMLGAEIVGKHYFQTLYAGIDNPVLRAVFSQIVRDEDGHIAFQSDRLRKVFASVPGFLRPLLRGIWWTIYQAAFLVVVYDHRHLLSALSVSGREFMYDCDRTYHEVSALLFAGHAATDPHARPEEKMQVA